MYYAYGMILLYVVCFGIHIYKLQTHTQTYPIKLNKWTKNPATLLSIWKNAHTSNLERDPKYWRQWLQGHLDNTTA